jgi:type I restriction enzyme S subunit
MKFRKETEFQKTGIGEIPKEWKLERLGRLVSYIKGRRPKRLYDEKLSEEFIPYLTAEYMRGLEKPKWCSLKEDPKVIRVQYDDVIMIWDGSYSGHVFTGFEGVLASTMIKIIPSKEIDKRFLYYYLTKNFQKLRGTTVGTGIPHVNKKVFEELLIPLPSLNEQKRIAEILLRVDNAIEGADKAIVKLERLKRGLMGELLTGRIRVREENGRLSFYRETELQETEIGKIPREWKTVKLSSIARIIMGQSPPSDTYNREGLGMPFLQGKMEFGRMYPSPTTYTTQPLKIAEPNDILISVRAPVGDVNIAPYKVCIGRGLAAIRFNLKTANHMFYFYYFQYIKKQLETLGKGSTFKAITKKDLEELLIPLPPIKEQEKVSGILTMIDKTIELYHEERERLDRLKRGLMDLLLTGKVRVVDGDVGS